MVMFLTAQEYEMIGRQVVNQVFEVEFFSYSWRGVVAHFIRRSKEGPGCEE